MAKGLFDDLLNAPQQPLSSDAERLLDEAIAALERRTPYRPKRRDTHVTLFWTTYQCSCGSRYFGPRFPIKHALIQDGPMLRTETRKGTEFTPCAPDARLELPRQVEFDLRPISVCPGCLDRQLSVAKALLFINAMPCMLTAQRQLTWDKTP